jgi:hypothetical protein
MVVSPNVEPTIVAVETTTSDSAAALLVLICECFWSARAREIGEGEMELSEVVIIPEPVLELMVASLVSPSAHTRQSQGPAKASHDDCSGWVMAEA